MTITDLGETTGMPQFIGKGWGYELIFANTQGYCGKLLHIVSGKRVSVHYHAEKHETFYLHKGKIKILYHDNAEELQKIHNKDKNKTFDCMEHLILEQGQTFTVPVGRVHQMIALQDSELFEFSTTDKTTDSYRIVKGD